MDFSQAVKIIYQKKWLIFWLTILGAVLVFDLMVIQTPQYQASSKILVIQKQVAGQDIYSISKSAQYLCRILKEGVYSDSFFDKVIESTDNIKLADFSSQLKERRKEWQKTIKVKILRDLGVMEIDVFWPEKEKAGQISQAIIQTIVENHSLYHGAAKNVQVRVLDNTLVSQKPISINLWLGTILGALFGFLIGLAWVLRKKPAAESASKTSSLNGSKSSA